MSFRDSGSRLRTDIKQADYWCDNATTTFRVEASPHTALVASSNVIINARREGERGGRAGKKGAPRRREEIRCRLTDNNTNRKLSKGWSNHLETRINVSLLNWNTSSHQLAINKLPRRANSPSLARASWLSEEEWATLLASSGGKVFILSLVRLFGIKSRCHRVLPLALKTLGANHRHLQSPEAATCFTPSITGTTPCRLHTHPETISPSETHR